VYYKAILHFQRNIKRYFCIAELARAETNQIEEQRALATIGRTYFCLAESIVNDGELYQSALSNAKNAYMKSLDLCER
jgi:NF-kappa-B inhibitor-like protein 2